VPEPAVGTFCRHDLVAFRRCWQDLTDATGPPCEEHLPGYSTRWIVASHRPCPARHAVKSDVASSPTPRHAWPLRYSLPEVFHSNALQLEITEEFLMAHCERARAILTRIRRSGVQISVDDFGTGYRSLSYLRDLPIDQLKLDRSFIFPMADDGRATALVASTIALAHSLGLRMVAKGVENDFAYTDLTQLGCDQAQGY
jgi:hypothetical protein